MFRRLNSIIWLLGLALMLLISACAPAVTPTLVPTASPTNQPTAAPLMLTDGLSHTIQLAAPPQRIISLAPSNTELVFAIGAGAQLIGREALSDYPAEAARVTSIGSTYDKLNTEAIVALKPDLILAAEITNPDQVKTLQGLGLTVYWLPNPKTYDDLYQNINTVGQITGQIDGAQKLIDALKTRFATVIDKVKGAATRPTVFYEVDGTDPTKPWTSGPGTFLDTVITLAGGQNVGRVLKDPFGQISSEELIKQNPDIIILGDTLYGVTIDSISQRAGWKSIAAVKNKAIYSFDDNLVSRPGPRLLDGLEQMAKLLHPELFK
jgi:iron complex transport system substrate-binding protein